VNYGFKQENGFGIAMHGNAPIAAIRYLSKLATSIIGKAGNAVAIILEISVVCVSGVTCCGPIIGTVG